ncbi:MAG: hypothetical protein ABFE02_01495 [Sulfuricella sp.]
MTKPAKLKFTIYQGATFRKRLRWGVKATGVPIDLTGCTARMQVRAETSAPIVLLELTTENGGITLGGTAGIIDFYVGATTTAAFTWERGVFDLEIIHPGALPDDVTRLAEGSITVSPEVTRG